MFLALPNAQKKSELENSLGHPVLDGLEDEGGVLVEIGLDGRVADPGEVTLARGVVPETPGNVEHVGYIAKEGERIP